MNPRFKFRIWCVAWKPARFGENELQTFGADKLQDIFERFFNNPLYIVQQSTGLFDKNGKEVFEGDILKYEYNKLPGKTHNFAVQWSKFTQSGGFETLSFFRSQNAEIIGNIFENPELLNEET
jgi:uncharacterized phage protein (TIGR01671 family)